MQRLESQPYYVTIRRNDKTLDADGFKEYLTVSTISLTVDQAPRPSYLVVAARALANDFRSSGSALDWIYGAE